MSIGAYSMPLEVTVFVASMNMGQVCVELVLQVNEKLCTGFWYSIETINYPHTEILRGYGVLAAQQR